MSTSATDPTPRAAVPMTDLRGELARKESKPAEERLLAQLQGNKHIKHIVLLSDFGESLSPPELRLYHGGDDKLIDGYALRVGGEAPVGTGSAKTAYAVGMRTGSATSRYAITDDGSNTDASMGNLESKWRAAHDAGKLPHFDALDAHSHVALYRAHDPTTPNDKFYLAVRAGDTPSAMALVESLQRRTTPATLAELAKSNEYNDLLVSSQHVRDQLAHSTAKALGIRIGDTADITTPTHHIVRATASAHGAGTATTTHDGTEEYVVYNGAADTSTAHKGALVYQGLMGGYAHVRGTKVHTTGAGYQSRAWKTSALSTLATNSPHYIALEHGESALHRQASGAAKVFERKVVWEGNVGAHPLADERRALVTDSSVSATAQPNDADQKLLVTSMQLVAGVLPEHTPRMAHTFEELATAAADQPGALQLPIPFNSEAMKTVVTNFDAVEHKKLPHHVITTSTRVPRSELFTSRSACSATDSAHCHPWYDETAEQIAERGRTHPCMKNAPDSVCAQNMSVVMIDTDLVRSIDAHLRNKNKQQ